MISANKIKQSIANLDFWFDTWEKDGGIYGYVLHHHKDNLQNITPDVLTQFGVISAHLNLYLKTKKRKWIDKAVKEGLFLVGMYSKKAHLFLSSSYEDKPNGATLVYNAFGCLVLLKLYQFVKNKEFLEIAKDCIDSSLTKDYWDDDAKSFKQTINNARTLNMGSITISALTTLSKILKNDFYVKKYAIPQAKLILECQVKEGRLKGAYLYEDKEKTPLDFLLEKMGKMPAEKYFTFYNAWTIRGLLDLYEYTNDQKYLKSAKESAQYIMSMVDSKTNLFYHHFERNKLKRYPEWVASSGAIIYILTRLQKYGIYFDFDKIFESLLERQLKTGGFPNTLGYINIFVPSFFPAEPEKKKWKDMLAIPGWNSQLLEALTEFLPNGTMIPRAKSKFPTKIATDDGFIITESKKDVSLEKNGKLMAHFVKTNPLLIFNNLELATDALIAGLKAKIWYKKILIAGFISGFIIAALLILSFAFVLQ